MSREFNNGVTTDLMTYASNMPAGLGAGAGSVMVVGRIMATNDAIWVSFVESDSSGGTNPGPSLGRHSNGQIYFGMTTISKAVGWTDSDNWCVICATRAAGTTTPNFYKVPIGGSTTTAAGDASSGNLNNADRIRLGGPSDPAHIRIAAVAWWSSALSQANIESVATAKTTQSILDLSPAWCVDDSDGLATDLVGTADRTAISGTSDNADDPSGWVYFGAAGGPSQRFRWRD